MKPLLNLLIFALILTACGGEEDSKADKGKHFCYTVGGDENCMEDKSGNYTADHLSGELENRFGFRDNYQGKVIIQEIATEIETSAPSDFKGKSYDLSFETKDGKLHEGLTFTITSLKKVKDASKFAGAQYIIFGDVKGEIDGKKIKNATLGVTAPIGERIKD